MSQTASISHRALVYDDRDDVVAELAPSVWQAVGNDEAVMISVDADLRERFSRELGQVAHRVTMFDVGTRYARPVEAMGALWRFTRSAFAAGAPRVHSIGELRVEHGELSPEWQWYESACNDVLADVPLVATCLYDATVIDPSTAVVVARTHPEFCSLTGLDRPSAFRSDPPVMPDPPRAPEWAPDVSVRGIGDPRSAREALVPLVLAGDVHERARLIVSELVTNAIRHGSGAADLDVWVEGDDVAIRIRDAGGGLLDPFATIRPVRETEIGGAGLWICHVEADAFAIRSDDGVTEAVALIRSR